MAGVRPPPWPERRRNERAPSTTAGYAQDVFRSHGRRQITYAGRPLYYYVGDAKAGQILCQNAVEFGGTWLVVRPSGKLVR